MPVQENKAFVEYQRVTGTKKNSLNKSPEELIEGFMLDAQIRGVSPATLRAYDCHIMPLINYLSGAKIAPQAATTQDIKAFIKSCLDRNLSIATINDYIRVAKQFFGWMVDERIIAESPVDSIKKLKEPKKDKPILSPAVIARMIDKCPPKSLCGIRNKAIIQLMWDCGLRRNEVLTAQTDDLNLKANYLKVTGKGNKAATVPLSTHTIKTLRAWLKARKDYKSPYLFISDEDKPLSKHYLTLLVSRLGRKIGVKVYPHLIRHSVITWLAEQGMDPFDLQAFARHESLSTTMAYVQKARLAKHLPEIHRKYSPGNKVA